MRQAPAPHAPEQHRVLVVANETVGGSQLLETIRERIAGPRRARARRLPGAQLAASPLGLRRGRRAAEGAGAARREPGDDAGRGHPGGRRDRRRRPDPGDRGRAPHVPARRADRLDASGREVALARARRRREGARALRAAGHPRRRRSPLIEIDAGSIRCRLRAELRDVHRAALGAGALSDEWASDRLPRHAARDDFVFLAARDDGMRRRVRVRLHGRARPVVDRPRRAGAHGGPARASGSTRRTSRSSSCTCGPRTSAAGSARACSRSS